MVWACVENAGCGILPGSEVVGHGVRGRTLVRWENGVEELVRQGGGIDFGGSVGTGKSNDNVNLVVTE